MQPSIPVVQEGAWACPPQRLDRLTTVVMCTPLIGATLLSKLAVPPFGEKGVSIVIPLLLIAAQGPSARHDHFSSVGFRVLEFTFPTPSPQKFCPDVIARRRKNGPQKVMRALSNRLLRRPPIQLLRSPIPIGDDVIHISDEDRVVCQIEQASLLGSRSDFEFQFVASLKKLCLHAAPNGAETCN